MALAALISFKTDIVTGPAGDKQSTLGHATIHNQIGDTLNKLQQDVGIDGTADTTSLKYLVANTSSSNPGHKHTLANGATDVTSSAAELNILDGATLSVSELNVLDGITASTAELNKTDGTSGALIDVGSVQTITGVKTFDTLSLTSGTTTANAINFGADVNLYRAASNVIRTDDLLVAGLGIDLGGKIRSFDATTAGEIRLSSSGGAYDVNIYAGASNTLKTDDNLTVAGGTIEAGASDTTAGAVSLYGSGAGSAEGGQVNLFLAADHDGTFESWSIDVYEDDLRFFRSDAGVTNTMTAAGQLQLPTTGSAGGLLIGGDTNLYREASNTLRTDDQLTVGSDIVAVGKIKSYTGGSNGTINLSSSDGSYDVDLYASASNTLKTSDYFVASAGLATDSDNIRVVTSKTPASAVDTGAVGQICWDSSYIYVCTATNTWKRVAISTWP